jgi:hypothetical protein
LQSTKTAAVKHALRNEIDRIGHRVPLRQRLRDLQDRVTSATAVQGRGLR